MDVTKMSEKDRKIAREKSFEQFKEDEKLFLASAIGHVKARYNSVPMRFRKRWLASYNGKLTRKRSIELFCRECHGWDSSDAVKSCPARGCPLWNYRPQ
jgi:hypothetical protein